MLENQTLLCTHEDPLNELFRKIYCKVLHWQGKQTNVPASWTEPAPSDLPAWHHQQPWLAWALFPVCSLCTLAVAPRRCSCTLGLCWKPCEESRQIGTFSDSQWARLLRSKTHLSGSTATFPQCGKHLVHSLRWKKWPKSAGRAACSYFSSAFRVRGCVLAHLNPACCEFLHFRHKRRKWDLRW